MRGHLVVRDFHVDWATPSLSSLAAPSLLDVAFAPACQGLSADGSCIPQLGTSQKLSPRWDLMYRAAYRHFDDHDALVVNHNINAGTSIGIRWYEIRFGAAGPSLYQQGTFAPDSLYRFMGSAAMDKAGNIALGYSVSSSTTVPGLRFTGRRASDPLGVMTAAESILSEGIASQTGSDRWGDYSSLAIDPVDGCTFWYTGEYMGNGGYAWHTRIGSFKDPACGAPTSFSLSVSPGVQAVNAGGSVSSTVAASGTANGIALSTAALPSGFAAAFTPSAIDAGGTATLTLSAPAGSAGSSYTIQIVGTAASATATASVALQVAPDAFSLAVQPASLTLAPGATAQVAVATQAVSGNAQAVSLSISGLPAGMTATFSPASVKAGEPASLTLAAAQSVAPASVSCTVTGSAGSLSHTALLQLQILLPGAPRAAMLAPGSGDVLSGNTAVRAEGATSAGGGLAELAVLLDGSTVLAKAAASPLEVSWDTTQIPDGTHRLVAMATDKAGNRATSEVTVTVRNASPATPPPPSAADVGRHGCNSFGDPGDLSMALSFVAVLLLRRIRRPRPKV
jgi:hypothetical protein